MFFYEFSIIFLFDPRNLRDNKIDLETRELFNLIIFIEII